MEKSSKKATKAQRDCIDNMMSSGLIDRDDVRNIIAGRRLSNPKDPLVFWENLSPGNGAQIMKSLRRFYDWNPALNPELPDLQTRAQKAVFWREIKGVRTFRHAGEVEVYTSLNDSLQSALLNSLEDPFRFSFQSSFSDPIGRSLRSELGDAIWGSFRDSALEPPARPSSRPSSWDSTWGSVWESFWDALRGSLFYAANFVPTNTYTAAKFKFLHDLWLAGNFPVGFDKDGNLLILVAD